MRCDATEKKRGKVKGSVKKIKCFCKKTDKAKDELSDASNFLITAGVLRRYEGSSTVARIPPEVVEIGPGAFAGYDRLKFVIIPEGVTYISDGAFNGCVSLTEIEIPGSVASIKRKAFYGCSSLQTVTFAKGEEKSLYIDESAFAFCTSLEELETVRSIDYIGRNAFDHCGSLQSVELKSCEPIFVAENAFRSCPMLKRFEIHGALNFSVPFLPDCADKEKRRLKRVIVSEETRLKRSVCCGKKLSVIGKKCTGCRLHHMNKVF